jgi:hypothetical protein
MTLATDDLATRPFCPDLPRYYPDDRTQPFASQGYIQFPYDIPRRREHFCSDSFKHPAKANVYMIEELVKLVSQPGERILDPMSGTGTLMMATLGPGGIGWSGREVVLVEDAAIFHYYQQQSREMFLRRGVPDYAITLLHGPCQDYLPLPVDHIIFSPPYSSVLKFEAVADSTRALGGSTYVGAEAGDPTVFQDYLGTKDNFGRLNQFMYNQKISKVYGLMIAGLRAGGTLTVIVQDMMKDGARAKLSEWVMRTCVRQGVELIRWEVRHAPGTGYKKSMRAKGFTVVEGEDIIIMRKPGP